MRRINFCLIIFLFCFGCKKFLDQKPLAKMSVASGYETQDDAEEALSATYHTLLNFPGISGYSIYDIAADNAEKGGEGPSDGAYFNEIAYFTLTSTNYVAQEVWDNCYLGIHRANIVIEKVPNIDMDEDLKKRIIAEAKFIRAYDYFYLVTLYGDVPLITKSDVNISDAKRAPKSSVYNMIINDFKSASETLPLKSQLKSNEVGRVTKGAAEAYLGKVFLYKGDFQKAAGWFEKVINSGEYSLDPDYYHIFSMDAEHGPESIFEINYKYSPKYGSLANQNYIRQGSAGMYGYGFCCPTVDFIDAFEKGDPRLWQSVYKNGDELPDGKIANVGNIETGYMSKKAYLPSYEFPSDGDPRHSGKDELVYRYGELLLWYAESANEIGNTSQALWALNKIRKRARQGNANVLPDITITDKNKLRKKIWHEERVEYGLENQRYFDLLRQKRLGEVMTAYSKKYNSAKGKNFRKGVNELFPIPQVEIDLSQGRLKQNPGY